MKYSIAFAAAYAAAVQAQGCPPLELIYARATSEPPTGVGATDSQATFNSKAARTWSKGYGAAGYSLYTNVTALIPGAVGFPVPYPASFSGCTSENKGVSEIANRLQTRSSACPNTKFVLGGHSQGGAVTVRALTESIPASLLPKIIAVTMFGSPNCPSNVRTKCKSYCNQGDSICSGGSSFTGMCAGGSKSGGGGGLLGKLGGSGGGSAGGLLSKLGGGSSGSKFGGGSGLLSKLGGGGLGKRSAYAEAENLDLLRRQAAACGPQPAEKGHRASGSAHMAYNADGFYVKAAACYILGKFSGSG